MSAKIEKEDAAEVVRCWNKIADFMGGALGTDAIDVQSRVVKWMPEVFPDGGWKDPAQRDHRFLEEALELVQSCGMAAHEARMLVDYVFARPAGDKVQEAGGVVVTLAALCEIQGFDMEAAGLREMARIEQPETIEKIRKKQKAKPAVTAAPRERHQSRYRKAPPDLDRRRAWLRFQCAVLAGWTADYIERDFTNGKAVVSVQNSSGSRLCECVANPDADALEAALSYPGHPGARDVVPDYPADRDAIADLVKAQPEGVRNAYLSNLRRRLAIPGDKSLDGEVVARISAAPAGAHCSAFVEAVMPEAFQEEADA